MLKYPVILLAACLCLAPLHAGTAKTSEPSETRFATVFTFLDAVFDTNKLWSRADVVAEMANAKALGVERMYWRIDGGGLFVYPTKVGTPYRWDGRGSQSAALEKSIELIGDPLLAFAEEAKKQGIEFFAWYPIRDRNSTSHRWNPKDPTEKEIYDKAGRYVAISEFYEANPHFNMERRHGDGADVPTPTIQAIRLRTANAEATLTEADLQIWQSDDNLEYEPLPDDWSVRRENSADGEIIFTLSGIEASKPWIKVAKREQNDWAFSGGGLDQWITVVDESGKEWPPHVWVAIMDKNPRYSEARFPYRPAARAKHVRNDVPWDTITKIGFDRYNHSFALFTPAMQPERYLLGYPCFAYPEVRAFEMRVIEELLSYPIDGISIGLRTHVRSSVGEEYGFNEPVIEEYQKRHGAGIPPEDFEADKLFEIEGDYYTQMLTEISEAVRADGRKLMAMFEPLPELGLEYMPGQNAPWWDLGRKDWQWERWVEEDLVDGLMVFTTGFNLPWDDKLQDYLAEVRCHAADKEISLFYDPDYNPRRQSVSAFLKIVQGALASPLVDEINVFEYVEFNKPGQQLNDAVKSMNLGAPVEP